MPSSSAIAVDCASLSLAMRAMAKLIAIAERLSASAAPATCGACSRTVSCWVTIAPTTTIAKTTPAAARTRPYRSCTCSG